ncbi:hypothetical protein NDAWWUGD_CDS0151 [Salmonella phage SeKF_80]
MLATEGALLRSQYEVRILGRPTSAGNVGLSVHCRHTVVRN